MPSEKPVFADSQTEYVVCHFCGLTWKEAAAEDFDLSVEMVPVCPEHAEGCR